MTETSLDSLRTQKVAMSTYSRPPPRLHKNSLSQGCFWFGIRLEGCAGCRGGFTSKIETIAEDKDEIDDSGSSKPSKKKKEIWRPKQLILEQNAEEKDYFKLCSPLEEATTIKGNEEKKEALDISLDSSQTTSTTNSSSVSNSPETANDSTSRPIFESTNISQECPPLVQIESPRELMKYNQAQAPPRRRIMSSPQRKMQQLEEQLRVQAKDEDDTKSEEKMIAQGEKKLDATTEQASPISSYDGKTWQVNHYPLPPGVLTQHQMMNNAAVRNNEIGGMLTPHIAGAKTLTARSSMNCDSKLGGPGLQNSWSGVMWDSLHDETVRVATSSTTNESDCTSSSETTPDQVERQPHGNDTVAYHYGQAKSAKSGGGAVANSTCNREKKRPKSGVLKRRPNDNNPLFHRSYEEQAKNSCPPSFLPKTTLGKLTSSVSNSSLASVDSDGTDFDECEASLQRAESERRVIFCLEKNVEFEITALCDMSWRILRDCYWQPEEYAAMSQSRIWLERAVMRTGGRVRIRGESRRGLGLVCEPETRIARATKIQRTQRAVLRLHTEGASALKLAKFAQDASSWATRNALISAQKDLAAAHEPDSPPSGGQRIEQARDANLIPGLPGMSSHIFYHRQVIPRNDHTIFGAGFSNSSSVLRSTMRICSTGDLITHTKPMTSSREPPYLPGTSIEAPAGPISRCNSSSSDTTGLAALIRSDSLKNIHGTGADALTAYATSRAKRRQHPERIVHAQAHSITAAGCTTNRDFEAQSQMRKSAAIITA